jgi:dipeptidyl aminopeptidase/acylaminoacyl peptidase
MGEVRFGRPARMSLLFGLALLALFTLCRPAHAFPGTNGKIAYSASNSVDFKGDISTINPDGTGAVNLTNSSATNDGDPEWSPDGTKILFNSDRGPTGIWVMDADGSNPVFLAAGGGAVWSPDGRKIAYTNSPDGIYVMNADGTNQVALGVFGYDLAWSPDGDKIAFERDVSLYHPELFVMNPDGTDQTRLTYTTWGACCQDWSPNGQKLALYLLSNAEDCCGGIAVMNSDGTGVNQLTFDDYVSTGYASWSPDGQKLVFALEDELNCGAACNYDIYTMNPDGTGASRVTTNATSEIAPDWQPLNNPSLVKYGSPASASSLQASLVPLFKRCGAAGTPTNAEHAPPLAVGSCSPPAPSSPVARTGSTSQGSAQLDVTPGDGDPTNGDQADVGITTTISDVQTPGGADYNPNASGPELTQVVRLRITDHASGGSSLPATTSDLEFAAPIDCAATADTSVGATCTVNTSSDTLMPGFAKEGKQAVIQVFRVRVYDSGRNGSRENGTGDDRIFAHQGIFIP